MGAKMVLFPNLQEGTADRIRDLGMTIAVASSEQEALDEISDAEAYYGRMTPQILKAGKNLRWVQATSAGLDNYFFPELRESPLTVTSLRGIYSDVIADHVFGFVLSFARGFHIYGRRQSEGNWEKEGVEVIHLAGKTLGVIGLGGIGLEVAKRGNVFGMRVLAVDPAPKGTPEYVEKIFEPSELIDVLKQVDFVAICVPHTGETEFMIDADALRAMKPGAILINIGRGKVVNLEALTEALQSGEIGGAGLDVFQEEPLAQGHALWSMTQVVITPHVAGKSPEIMGRRTDVIVENARRFLKGEEMLNVVDKERGYVVARNE